MENHYGLMEYFQDQAAVQEASERFDKRALLHCHDKFARQLRESAAEGSLEIRSSVTDPCNSGGAACSIPLEKLHPISFNELKVGEVHRGRVVYGTLCADAYKICSIVTLLEDDNGLAVRLEIYNAAPSQAEIKRLYPRGAKLAIKEPYFKVAADTGLIIRVDNPANVVKLMTEKGTRTESLPPVDVEDVRKEGNRCFREQNWDAAAEHYTKCIDTSLLQLKESSSSVNNNIINGLLHAYSNRAETRLRLKEFELALEDSDKALRIDSGNLKALYRKGRALVELRQYAAACECWEKVAKASPAQKEIQDTLHQAKTLYAQSLNGKYDISDYLLGRASSPPTVADFVGSVEIKMTEDGRGRGLYATHEIRIGQLLLVSNAVAVDYESAFPTIFHVDRRCEVNTASREHLVSAVVCAAKKSQRLLRQLYSLQDSSTPGTLDVPAIDLFKTDGQMSAGQEVQNEYLRVDVNRIRDVITFNSFSEAEGTLVSKWKICEFGLNLRERIFRGLWLLPSFINHSCLPNSSLLDVGSAIFIHASKPIERGEEITIPYFNALDPLPERQAKCRYWGFKCKCMRCILEHSFRTSLEPIITIRFEQFYDKANKVIAGRSIQQLSDVDLPECAQFARISLEAEEIIRSSTVLETEEEKRWIRASFASAYFLSTMLSRCFPCGQKFKEAIQSTDPGDFRNLGMAVGHLKYLQSQTGDENEAFITRHASDQAKEACISVFGRHSDDVLKALVLKF